MRCWRQETLNLAAGPIERVIKAGIYSGVLLRFWGDAAAGCTIILADLGNILGRFRSRSFVNVRVAELWVRTNLRGGRPEAASAIGAAWAFSVILPFRYGPLNTANGDDNVVNARTDDLALLFDCPALPALVDTAFVDIVPLMDTGAARYIPQIGSQLYEYTGQDRIRLNVPNIRELLIQEPAVAAALPASIQLSSDGRYLNEGNWAEFLALTDIDSDIAVGAAATGYVMPDLGNRNPATWARGRYELLMVGTTAGAFSFIVEFGAEPVSIAEHSAVNAIEQARIGEGMSSSPLPPSTEMAPIENRGLTVQAPARNTVPIPRQEAQTREARTPTPASRNTSVRVI